MSARAVGIAAALFLIVVLVAASVLDRTTPPVAAAILGVVFGYMLGALVEGRF